MSTIPIPITATTEKKQNYPRTKNNEITKIKEIILHPARIAALQKCDSDVIQYTPTSFLPIIFTLKGRNLHLIFFPLLLLLIWGVVWCIIFEYDESLKHTLEPLEELISPLLIPVSFLLVFRLGRAAVRYWDARAAMGRVVEGCRVLSSTVFVRCYNMKDGGENEEEGKDDLADLFARWICVFPIAVKNFLRPLAVEKDDTSSNISFRKRRYHCVDGQRKAEIGSLLDTDDTEDALRVNDTRFGPIFVLNQLRHFAYEVSIIPTRESSGDGAVYRQLNNEIDALTGAWGAMERINSTPLPFAYVAHLRTFLMIYLLLWHIEAIARNGWIALPALFVGSWGLLGVEAASVECERPFRWSSNHLPLGRMCIVVANNVTQSLEDVKVGVERRRRQQHKWRKGIRERSNASTVTSSISPSVNSGELNSVEANSDTWIDDLPS